MQNPRALLMCPPDAFDVVDVKNPFMEGQMGAVDRALARVQWDTLRTAFESAGMPVETIDPTPACEDMVFCANPTFPFRRPDGELVCLLGRMRHASRRRETAGFRSWFERHGYRLIDIDASFEGGGDALAHPRRPLVWGGIGPRTDEAAYPLVHDALGVEVVILRLAHERYYHLDTCLCILDESRALVFEPAFESADLDRLRSEFDELIAVPADEAARMACNAVALPGGSVVIQAGCPETHRALTERGYRVLEVETGEFMKSGGSVFCLKQFLY